jgi:hypothetical protein
MKLYLRPESIVATVIIVSALILILLNGCTYVDVVTDEVQITITGEQGR